MAKANPRAVPGNNSGVNAKYLRGLVEEIEKAEDEKSLVSEHIKEIYTGAKAKGYEPVIIKRIITKRKKNREKLREEEQLEQSYMFAIDPELADVLS